MCWSERELPWSYSLTQVGWHIAVRAQSGRWACININASAPGTWERRLPTLYCLQNPNDINEIIPYGTTTRHDAQATLTRRWRDPYSGRFYILVQDDELRRQ